MKELKQLFDNNRAWAEDKVQKDPDTFKRLSKKQTPKYLWIGCSDSRIPANEVLGLEPGEVFVHRNIANLVPHSDINCLSVIQYGIDYLDVEHIIVCGHYGCGGALAAMENGQFGLVDNWLRHLRDVYFREKEMLDTIADFEEKSKRFIELNVLYQVMNVCYSTIVQSAWAQEKKLSIHGWVYDISTGYLKDLNCCISSLDQIDKAYLTLKLH
ncbi:MAG: carbonate dehydratase [Simkaniaceae bacterium]|nr:carbonate dehydratase [Simkaniaceae bacterium]